MIDAEKKSKREKSQPLRVALIGLVGTVLTVCGGLSGAIISGAVTVYRVERERQLVALAAPVSEQELSIDTGEVFISRQEAASLDPESYHVDLNYGVAIQQPMEGWSPLEELTVAEDLAETSGYPVSPPLSEQPVLRIRYGEPIEIEFDRYTLVNGHPMLEQTIGAYEQLYGAEPWTLPYYSQVTINIFDKPVVEELGFVSLSDMFLGLMRFSEAHINRLVANEGSHFIVAQTSVTYDNVRLEGHPMTVTMEKWLLVAETEDTYYNFEIVYMPQSGHSLQVWEDLQTYMDSFHVVD
ncbi:MAG: hypothetical protein PVI59_03630 [Anaerolineae bacterium]|jgi:hypothetical protein